MSIVGATAEQRLLIEACFASGAPFYWSSPGTLMIRKSELAPVLAQVVKSGRTVLGFEGFEFDGFEVHPQLHLIADFGTGSERLEDLLAAISGWPDGAGVDVTIAI